jgi:hypothetical protein
MRRRALKLLVSALMVLGASGCVESARVGAPNTQAHEWPETRTARSYDVIANDTNSCVRPGSEQRDPMPWEAARGYSRGNAAVRLTGSDARRAVARRVASLMEDLCTALGV